MIDDLLPQRYNILAWGNHPHRELFLQLCRQQRWRHTDLPLEVTKSDDNLSSLLVCDTDTDTDLSLEEMKSL